MDKTKRIEDESSLSHQLFKILMLCAIEVTNVDGEHKIIYTIFSDYVAAQMNTQKKERKKPNHLTVESPQFMQK